MVFGLVVVFGCVGSDISGCCDHSVVVVLLVVVCGCVGVGGSKGCLLGCW